MRKVYLFTILIMMFALVGCGSNEDGRGRVGEAHQHSWIEATCEEPKKCEECGEVEGEALGHDWLDATCTELEKCSRCGKEQGEALEHVWTEATCTEPRTCSVCGATEGEALGHSWVDATCTEAKKCSVCGETEGDPLGHDAPGLSCTDAAICNRCNEEIEALGHDWIEATCIVPKTCDRCGLTEGSALGHEEGEPKRENEKNATCTTEGQYDEAIYCSVCGIELSRETKTEEALGHTTAHGTCSRCGEYIVEPIVFSGSGDKVISDIEVPQGIYKVVMSNRGSSNFIVHAYQSNGNRLSSLANEIGNYDGSIFLADNIDGGILEVKSSGKWTISFETIPGGGTSNISGKGDWVSPWFTLKKGALVVTLSNKGNSNFIVHIYDEYGNRYYSLANEIGDYSGSTVFNEGRSGVKYCIEVVSSGSWTVDFGLGDSLTQK